MKQISKRYDFILRYDSKVSKYGYETRYKKVRGYGKSRREAKKFVCRIYGCNIFQLSKYRGAI